jgi:NitT/TauT family transport system substrate-binding protein
VRRLRTFTAVILAAGLIATGCSSSKSTSQGGSKPLDKVTYLTGFGTFGREAYAFYGLNKGYFKDEGIDLKIVPGAGGAANLPLMAQGKAQFSAIDYSGAVVAVGKGNTAFKIISAVHQRTLISIMALAGGKISTPQDLPGKTIGVATGTVPKTLYPAYAKLANIPSNPPVKFVDSNPSTLPALLASHQVDAIGQFVISAPSVLAAAKAADPKAQPKVVALAYSDYMTDLYGNVLVAPTSLINSNPDLVRRFNRAYLKSLANSTADPEGSAAALHKDVSTVVEAPAVAEVKLMAPYVGEANQIGSMDTAKVARGIALIQSTGLIPAGFDPNKMVAFDFVPKGSTTG